MKRSVPPETEHYIDGKQRGQFKWPRDVYYQTM